ncbi:class I SAM-dependent methyltransferase [Thiorhodococcus minor]|uniref:Class I SAM-dependent methyltransferase n=1 Tax=Thiorhodococcus minor TaxID=57489 RepID=A0A6M0JZS4_9GAMM|nr:class I SAM-dependent methyltransferase [Thiorhodococcus minor]NEV61837.1 class I SAM-dependent methyltransferase [Thiorhodococcus minor]
MSAFSADWLALREPADHAARSPELTRKLADWAKQKGRLRILDLGAGTGSNLRYLAPRLGVDQEWRLLDHDAELLVRLPEVLLAWAAGCGYPASSASDCIKLQIHGAAVRVSWSQADLAGLFRDEHCLDSDLVTASALLDLVSLDWIQALARSCSARASAALLALTYDGRIQWEPGIPGDERVRDLLNRHQRQDKGLGVALGPEGGAAAAACFADVGRSAELADSGWRLGTQDGDLQDALVRGWAEAVVEVDPAATDAIEIWLESRLDHIASGASRLIVGHCDLLSLPLEP